MIQIQGVRKRYGKLSVLEDLDLEIEQGRVTALVGPNGTGKTTLIKMILGLATPDAGAIRIDGALVGRDPAYRARIGYMPQIARFPDNLTGTELIRMLQDLRGGAAGDRRLIDAFGLLPQLGRPLRTLSGGTRQKVNAVLAFLFDPELLILDEPSAGLDPLSSSILKDRILADRAAGKTFLLTSHVMSELEELADDVAFLLDGKVRFLGSIRELKLRTRQENLERAIARMMTAEAAV